MTKPNTRWSHPDYYSATNADYSPGHDRPAREQAAGHLVDGYAPAGKTEDQQRREAAKAQGWRYDAQLEHLDHLRTTDPAAFSKLTPAMKLSLGFYSEAKAAAASAGINTDAPA
jgi:hypothetical protein